MRLNQHISATLQENDALVHVVVNTSPAQGLNWIFTM